MWKNMLLDVLNKNTAKAKKKIKKKIKMEIFGQLSVWENDLNL